jgi:hypothetical protein
MKRVGFILETIEMTLRKERRGMLKKSQIQTGIRVAINNYFDKQLTIYRATGKVPTPLHSLLKTSTLSLNLGVGTLPTDFSKELSFYIPNVNSNPAEFMNRAEFEERKNSVILPPTEIDPIAVIEDNKIYVRPPNSPEIIFTYIKRPTEILIATTVSDDGRNLDYDDANSVETDFHIEYCPDIIKEALQFLSVPQQDSGANQLGATTKV